MSTPRAGHGGPAPRRRPGTRQDGGTGRGSGGGATEASDGGQAGQPGKPAGESPTPERSAGGTAAGRGSGGCRDGPRPPCLGRTRAWQEQAEPGPPRRPPPPGEWGGRPRDRRRPTPGGLARKGSCPVIRARPLPSGRTRSSGRGGGGRGLATGMVQRGLAAATSRLHSRCDGRGWSPGPGENRTKQMFRSWHAPG